MHTKAEDGAGILNNLEDGPWQAKLPEQRWCLSISILHT